MQQSFVVSNSDKGTYAGLYITHAPEQTVRQVLDECIHFGEGAVYPFINLIIKMPCGHEVAYKTIDEIPTANTPCACGNPDHYFVKIGVLCNQ